MSSQADILDIPGSGDAARKAFGLGPSSLTAFPFREWQAAWERLSSFQSTGQRLVILLGDPGIGKSTMLESLADALTTSGQSVTRFRGAQLDDNDFLHLVSISLGLNAEVHEPRALQAQLLAHLQAETVQRDLYFLVDEADVLGPSALTSLLEVAKAQLMTPRGLASDASDRPAGETGTASGNRLVASTSLRQQHGAPDKPLPKPLGGHPAQGDLHIVLAGTRSLIRVLAQCPVDLQGESNVGLLTLGALTASEIEGYLLHCLARSVETKGVRFSTGAAEAIHLCSQGVPRVVNRIAVRLFFCGPGCGSHCIRPSDVHRVARELQLEGLLANIPALDQLTLENTKEVPILDPGSAADRGLSAEIDKPVAALIASELEKRQIDSGIAELGMPEEGVRTSPQTVQPTAIPEEQPISPPSRRRERLVVPAFGLVMLVLTVVVGQILWNQDRPKSILTDLDSRRAGESHSGAGGEPEPPQIKGSTTTVIAPKFPEPPPKLAPGISAPTPLITQRQEAENERQEVKRPPALSVDDLAAIAARHRDPDWGESPATVGRGTPPISSVDAAEKSEAISASGGVPMSGGNLDTQEHQEPPQKLAPMARGPDPASVEPPPPLTFDEAVASGDFDAYGPGHNDPGTGVEKSVFSAPSDHTDLALLEPKPTDLPPQATLAETAEDPRLRQLLKAAALDLRSNRLTTPNGDNAFHRYQAVLEIDPENSEALEGLEAIASSYVALVERARADGELERAIAYLDRADSVLPDFPETADLRVQIEGELAADTRLAGVDGSSLSEPETRPQLFERFVMLPPRTTPGCAWPFDEHMIDAVSGLIQRASLNRVVLSTPRSNSETVDQQMDGLWMASGPNVTPDNRQAFVYGERVGARWLLLSRIDCPPNASVFEPWRNFQLHLFDIERGILHQGTGTVGEIASTTEKLLLSSIAVEGG